MRLTLLLLCTGPVWAHEVERDTERLADALRDLSSWVRLKRRTDFGRHLADTVTGRVSPATTEPIGPPVKGLVTRRWVPREPFAMSREEFVRRLEGLIQSHGRVLDLAFEPVASRLEGGVLIAQVKFFVVGRLARGKRLWSRGRYEVRVRDGKITGFVLESGTTVESERVWFREATPPEMRFRDPAVLDHPTLGLAAYGAAAADVDGDGRIDILSTGHDTNRLYLNRGGGRFALVEVKSPRPATAPLFLDYDNDGDPDLFLSANGKQMLLQNRRIPEGVVGFRDVSVQAGVDRDTIGFSAVAGDVNADGVPDIYVTAYNNYGPVAPGSWDRARNGLPNLLFVSRPDKTYEEAAARWKAAGTGWSYAAQFADLDGDGRLDLYVANDFGGGNPLYLNRGDGFEDVADRWGVRDNGYGMGVSFGDYDNDGDLDLQVSKMSSKAGNRILDRLQGVGRLRALAAGNALYRNVRNKRFEEVSATAGPFRAGWAWGGGFLDIDNDGWLDLHTPNGFLSGRSTKET